jgi:hypothetical protein
MFFTFLFVNFTIAAAMCFPLQRVFRTPVNSILHRLIAEDIYITWSKYLAFATYVVGISGGVRIWDLEKYITPHDNKDIIALTPERWALEIYRTILETLQSVAWMMLIFFLFALIAFVIVKGMEMRKYSKES